MSGAVLGLPVWRRSTRHGVFSFRSAWQSCRYNVRQPEEAISDFVSAFELVFANDWEKTKASIQNQEFLISEDGSFLNPGVSDESNNWANRGRLLATYRRLRALLDEQDVEVPPQLALTSRYSR